MLRLRYLVRALVLQGNLTDTASAAARALQLTPAYNASRFPTILSEAAVFQALSQVNTNPTTYLLRNTTAFPGRRLSIEDVSSSRWANTLSSALKTAGVKSPIGDIGGISSHIKSTLGSAGNKGASNSWVVCNVHAARMRMILCCVCQLNLRNKSKFVMVYTMALSVPLCFSVYRCTGIKLCHLQCQSVRLR